MWVPVDSAPSESFVELGDQEIARCESTQDFFALAAVSEMHGRHRRLAATGVCGQKQMLPRLIDLPQKLLLRIEGVVAPTGFLSSEYRI
jgi:hypothetical protein